MEDKYRLWWLKLILIPIMVIGFLIGLVKKALSFGISYGEDVVNKL